MKYVDGFVLELRVFGLDQCFDITPDFARFLGLGFPLGFGFGEKPLHDILRLEVLFGLHQFLLLIGISQRFLESAIAAVLPFRDGEFRGEMLQLRLKVHVIISQHGRQMTCFDRGPILAQVFINVLCDDEFVHIRLALASDCCQEDWTDPHCSFVASRAMGILHHPEHVISIARVVREEFLVVEHVGLVVLGWPLQLHRFEHAEGFPAGCFSHECNFAQFFVSFDLFGIDVQSLEVHLDAVLIVTGCCDCGGAVKEDLRLASFRIRDVAVIVLGVADAFAHGIILPVV